MKEVYIFHISHLYISQSCIRVERDRVKGNESSTSKENPRDCKKNGCKEKKERG